MVFTLKSEQFVVREQLLKGGNENPLFISLIHNSLINYVWSASENQKNRKPAISMAHRCISYNTSIFQGTPMHKEGTWWCHAIVVSVWSWTGRGSKKKSSNCKVLQLTQYSFVELLGCSAVAMINLPVLINHLHLLQRPRHWTTKHKSKHYISC